MTDEMAAAAVAVFNRYLYAPEKTVGAHLYEQGTLFAVGSGRMIANTAPRAGHPYTPEQVHANGWLGDITPSAMRKAAQEGKFQHTRLRGKKYFTGDDIAAILAASRVPAKDDTPRAYTAARRSRRTPSLTDVPRGVTP